MIILMIGRKKLLIMPYFVDCDPVIYEEETNKYFWMKAMDEEIHAIDKNEKWELATLFKGNKPIRVK